MTDIITGMLDDDRPLPPSADLNTFSDGTSVIGNHLEDSTYTGTVGNIDPSEWAMSLDDQVLPTIEPDPTPPPVEKPPVNHLDTPIIGFNNQANRIGLVVSEMVNKGEKVTLQKVMDKIVEESTGKNLTNLVEQGIIDVGNLHRGVQFDEFVKQVNPAFKRYARVNNTVPDMQVGVTIEFVKVTTNLETGERVEKVVEKRDMNDTLEGFHFYFPEIDQMALKRKTIQEDAQFETKDGIEQVTVMVRLGEAEGYVNRAGVLTPLPDFTSRQARLNAQVAMKRSFVTIAKDYVDGIILNAEHQSKTIAKNETVIGAVPVTPIPRTDLVHYSDDDVIVDYVDVLEHPELDVVMQTHRPRPWLPTSSELVGMNIDIGEKSEDFIRITYEPLVQHNLQNMEHIVRTMSVNGALGLKNAKAIALKDSDNENFNTDANLQLTMRDDATKTLKVHYSRALPKALGSLDYQQNVIGKDKLSTDALEKVSPTIYNPNYSALADKSSKSLLDMQGKAYATRVNRYAKDNRPVSYFGAKVLPEIIGKPNANLLPFMLTDLAYGHYSVTNTVDDILSTKTLQTAALPKSPIYKGTANNPVKVFSIAEHMLNSHLTGFITNDTVFKPTALALLKTDNWEKRFTSNTVGFTGIRFSPYNFSLPNQQGNKLPEEWTVLQDVPLNYHYLRRKDSFFNHPAINIDTSSLVGAEKAKDFAHFGNHRQPSYIGLTDGVHHARMLNTVPYYNVKDSTQSIGQALFKNLVNETKLTPDWSFVEYDDSVNNDLDTAQVGVKYKNDIASDFIHPASWLRARHINQNTPHIKVRHPNGYVYMYRNISAKYPQLDIRFSNKDLLSKLVSGIGLNARRKKTKPGEYNYAHPFSTLKRKALDTWMFANTYLKKPDVSAIINLLNAPNKYFDRYMKVYGNGITEIEEGAFGNAANFMGEMIHQFANDIRGTFVVPSTKVLVKMMFADTAKSTYSIPTRDRRHLDTSKGKPQFKEYQHPDAASMIPAGLLNFVFDEANKDNDDVKLIRYMLDRDTTNMYQNDYTYALDFLFDNTYQKLPEVIKFNDNPETGFLNYENLPNTALRDSKVVYETPNKHQSMRLANLNDGLDVATNMVTPVRIGAIKTITKDSENPDLNGSFVTGYLKPHILESLAVNLKSRRDYLMRGLFRSATGIYKVPRYHTANASQDYQIKHPLQSDKGFMELNLTVREADLPQIFEKIGLNFQIKKNQTYSGYERDERLVIDATNAGEKASVSVENYTSALQAIVKDYITETTGWDASGYNVSIVSAEEKAEVMREFGLKDKPMFDLTKVSQHINKFLEDVTQEDVEFSGNNIAGIMFGVGLWHEPRKWVAQYKYSACQGFYDRKLDADNKPLSLTNYSMYQNGTNGMTDAYDTSWKHTGVRKMRPVLVKLETGNDPHVYGKAYLLVNINIGDSINNRLKLSQMGALTDTGTTVGAFAFPYAGIVGHARGVNHIAKLDDLHTLFNYDDPFINETTRHKQVPSIVYKHLTPEAKVYLIQDPSLGYFDNKRQFSVDINHNYRIVQGKMPVRYGIYHANNASNSTWEYQPSGYWDPDKNEWVETPAKDIIDLDFTIFNPSSTGFNGSNGPLTLTGHEYSHQSYNYQPRRHLTPMSNTEYQPGVIIGRRYLYAYNYSDTIQVPILLPSKKLDVKPEGDSIDVGSENIDAKPRQPEYLTVRILDDKYYYDEKAVSPADFMRLATLGIMGTDGVIDVIRKTHEYELKKSFMAGRYITKVRPYDDTVTLPDMTILFLESKFSPWLKSIGYFHVSRVFDTRHLFSEIKTPTNEFLTKYGNGNLHNTYVWFDLPEYMELFIKLFGTDKTRAELAELTEANGAYLFNILRNNYGENAEEGSSFIYPDLAPVMLEYQRQKVPNFNFVVTHNMSNMQAQRIAKYGLRDMDKNPYMYADMWKTYSNTPTLSDLEVSVEAGQIFAPGFQGMITPLIGEDYSKINAWPNIDRNIEFDKFKVALDVFGHERVVMLTEQRFNEGDDLLYVTNKDDNKRIMTVGANSRINYLNVLLRNNKNTPDLANLPFVDETHMAKMVNEKKSLNTEFILIPAANHPLYCGTGMVTYRSPNVTEVTSRIPTDISITIREGFSDNVWLNTTMTDFRALLAQGRIDKMKEFHRNSLDFVGQRENWLNDPNYVKSPYELDFSLHKYRHVSDHMLPWLFPGLFVAEDANYQVMLKYIDELNKEKNKPDPKFEVTWQKDFLRFANPGYQTGGTPFVTLGYHVLKEMIGFTVRNGHFAKRAVRGSQVVWHLNDLIGKFHGANVYSRLSNRHQDIVTGTLRPIPNPYPNKYRNFVIDDAGKIFEIYEDGTVTLYNVGDSQTGIIRNAGDERRIPYACNVGEWQLGRLDRWGTWTNHSARTEGISSLFDYDPPNMTEEQLAELTRRLEQSRQSTGDVSYIESGNGFVVEAERLRHTDSRIDRDRVRPVLKYLEHLRQGGNTYYDRRRSDNLYYYGNSFPMGEMAYDILARNGDPRTPGTVALVPSLLGLHNFETLRDYRFSRTTFDVASYFQPYGENVSKTTTTYKLSMSYIDSILSGKLINPTYEIIDQTKNEVVYEMGVPSAFRPEEVKRMQQAVRSAPVNIPLLLSERLAAVSTCSHSKAQVQDDDKRYKSGYESKVGEYNTIHAWKAYPTPKDMKPGKIHSRKMWLMPGFVHQVAPLSDQEEYEEYIEPISVTRGLLPNLSDFRMYTGIQSRPWSRFHTINTNYGPGRPNTIRTSARDYKKTVLEPMPTRGFYSEIMYAYVGLNDIDKSEQQRLGEGFSNEVVKKLIEELNASEAVRGVRPKYPLYGLEPRLGFTLEYERKKEPGQ